VDAVLGDRRPTLDDIRALGFTTRCLNESMRLYPQPPVLIRRALEDDIVGGYRVGALHVDRRTDLPTQRPQAGTLTAHG
jgi:Cytochrome P450